MRKQKQDAEADKTRRRGRRGAEPKRPADDVFAEFDEMDLEEEHQEEMDQLEQLRAKHYGLKCAVESLQRKMGEVRRSRLPSANPRCHDQSTTPAVLGH